MGKCALCKKLKINEMRSMGINMNKYGIVNSRNLFGNIQCIRFHRFYDPGLDFKNNHMHVYFAENI